MKHPSLYRAECTNLGPVHVLSIFMEIPAHVDFWTSVHGRRLSLHCADPKQLRPIADAILEAIQLAETIGTRPKEAS